MIAHRICIGLNSQCVVAQTLQLDVAIPAQRMLASYSFRAPLHLCFSSGRSEPLLFRSRSTFREHYIGRPRIPFTTFRQLASGSTTYKTRVALENPCKERQGILIGQLKDRRVSKHPHFYSRDACHCASALYPGTTVQFCTPTSSSPGDQRPRRRAGPVSRSNTRDGLVLPLLTLQALDLALGHPSNHGHGGPL